jgi:hypothetical protein
MNKQQRRKVNKATGNRQQSQIQIDSINKTWNRMKQSTGNRQQATVKCNSNSISISISNSNSN